MNTESILRFLLLAEKMKTTRCDNLLSDGTYDSDADHTWLMCMMMKTRTVRKKREDVL
jgi:hypothetical protein